MEALPPIMIILTYLSGVVKRIYYGNVKVRSRMVGPLTSVTMKQEGRDKHTLRMICNIFMLLLGSTGRLSIGLPKEKAMLIYRQCSSPQTGSGQKSVHIHTSGG